MNLRWPNIGISIIAIFSLNAFALSQEQALKIAKSNFQFANTYLYEVAFSCMTHRDECELTSREDRLVTAVYYELLRHRGAAVKFDAESRNPGMFLVDGMVRIAFTGNHQGDDIYINEDMIVLKDGEKLAPLSIHEAVAILAHEYGHHHSMLAGSHEELDVIGQKLARQMVRYGSFHRFEVASIGLQKPETIAVFQYTALGNQRQRQEKSLLFVQTANEVVDLTPMVADRVECPRAFYREELEFEGPAFRFYVDPVRTEVSIAADAIVIESPTATMFCLNKMPGRQTTFESFENYKQFRAVVPLRPATGGLTLDVGSIQFDYVKPQDRRYY